jgi:hypothetical protein
VRSAVSCRRRTHAAQREYSKSTAPIPFVHCSTSHRIAECAQLS